MLFLLLISAVLSAFLPGLAAAVPLSFRPFRPFNATTCMEAAGLTLLRRDANATTAVAAPHPTNVIDGAAGTQVTPEVIGAIIGGALGILLLTTLLCWCGRKGRW